MMEMLPLSVGVGLAVVLICTEVFGIASAGLIVPGYIALYIGKPTHVAATLVVALVTYAIVRMLSTFLTVYGRRRTALMILIGYVIGMLARQWFGETDALTPIGFVIPGLVAVWMDRQTMTQTLASLVVVSAIVRLVLILVGGVEYAP